MKIYTLFDGNGKILTTSEDGNQIESLAIRLSMKMSEEFRITNGPEFNAGYKHGRMTYAAGRITQ